MREQILKFGEQFQVGITVAGNIVYDVPFSKIVIAAMGGSMIPGEILAISQPAIQLNQDYDLPKDLSEDSFVICISWSGNTEETISAYNEALKRNLKTLVITDGGQLASLATKNNTTLITLPKENLQPRIAVGYMVGALFKTLGLEKDLDFKINSLGLEKLGQEIALNIGTKSPLIYSTHQWQALTRFWKILFNENDKIHADSNIFPGLEHNELAGFNDKDKNKFHVIVLRDDRDDSRQKKNIDLTLAMLDKIGYNHTIVNLSGKTLLEKVFNSYTLALWTSYYLAEFLNVDPEKIDVIEEFKQLKQ